MPVTNQTIKTNKLSMYSIGRIFFISAFIFLFSLLNVQYASAALSVSTNDVNLTTGSSKAFTISGGTGYYKISSSSDATATASISGAAGTDGTIVGVSQGTATITITDSAGAVVTINVTVSEITLSKTNVVLLPNKSETITVLTGSTFYNVTTSDANVAKASVSGDSITITGVNAGTAVVTVSDSNSDTATISVLVGSSFTIDPATIDISIGQTATATISDPTGFYNASSNDASIATASITGTTVTVKGVSNGNAIITIENSAGFTSTIAVTVDVSLFTKINLGVSESKTVSLSGGSGFYKVNTIDTSVATVIITGDNAIITGLGAGKTLITIEDSKTNKVEFEVSVKLPAPVLDVSVNGTLVKLWWNKIAKADSYMLFAAPANASGGIDMTKIGQINVGSLDSLMFDLKSGDHYFAALQAVDATNSDISSLISNIVEIIVP